MLLKYLNQSRLNSNIFSEISELFEKRYVINKLFNTEKYFILKRTSQIGYNLQKISLERQSRQAFDREVTKNKESQN